MTLTLELPAEMDAELARLAEAMRRPKADIAKEAIAAHLEREAEIVKMIQEGIEDVRAGRVVPHREAMAQARAVVRAAAVRQR